MCGIKLNHMYEDIMYRVLDCIASFALATTFTDSGLHCCEWNSPTGSYSTCAVLEVRCFAFSVPPLASPSAFSCTPH